MAAAPRLLLLVRLLLLLAQLLQDTNTQSTSTAGLSVSETTGDATSTINTTINPISGLATTISDDGTVTVLNDIAFNSTSLSISNSSAVTEGSERKSSTPGIPDVTATSQRIILQTTGHPVETTVHSTDTTRYSVDTTRQEQSTTGTSTTRTTASTTPSVTDTPTTARNTEAVATGSQTVNTSPVVTYSTAAGGRANGTTYDIWTTESSVGNATIREENRTDVRTVLLTFNGTCHYDSSSVLDQLNGFSGFGSASCEQQIRLRLSTTTNISGLVSMVGVLRIRTRESVLVLSSVELLDSSGTEAEDEGFVPRLFEPPFSTREIITYAVVGGVFGVAIVLVAALLCCKCCCSNAKHRKNKSQDIPHLTLRLEDYSLTRIPRPNTLFGVSGGVHNGTADGGRVARQCIDTSVVPIDQEDFGSLRRGELRSFSGRRHRSRAPEMEEDNHSRCSPALTGSTERLARDFGARQPRRGNENKNFRF